MMYNILCDGISIYDSSPQSGLLNPKLDLSLNEPGSLTFDMLPTHSYYDIITPLTSNIEVLEGENVIFFGRVLDVTITFSKIKKITCEGALGFLYDTVQNPVSFVPSEDHSTQQTTIHDFFEYLLTEHNKLVTNVNRKIYPGTCNLTNKSISRELDYEKTMDCIKKMCIDSFGGYLFTRKDGDDIYLDWLRDLSGISNQPIQYAINLADYTNDFKGSDMVTSIIPIGDDDLEVSGKDSHEQWINQRNPGKPYIDSDAVATYGRICQKVDFDGITDATTLYEYGLKWLTDKQFDVSSIEVDAADLKYFNSTYENFTLGQSVHVTSTPHLIDANYPIMKISYALDSPTKTITVGTPPRQSLTDMYSGSGSSGSSSNGGSAKTQVKKIATSVVEQEVPNIIVQEVPQIVQYTKTLNGGVKIGSITVGENTDDIFTNTIYGTEDPSLSLGVDGNIYIKRVDSIKTVRYVRTNYSNFGLTLSNWNYKCTDKFELIYKNNRSPKEYTDYPYIIGSYRANGTFVLFIRYNLENSRTCMNINYNDHWTGNDAISFSSPFDYDNYYLLGANADYFYLKKGTDLDHIDTTEFTWSTYSLITQSDGPVKLFCDNPDGANNPMDMSLYGIKAYNSSNDLIHNYIPIENGLLDTVDMTMYTTNTTGHINGPEVPNDFNGCIDSIWYKKNGIWIKNNVVDLDASKAIDIDYEDYILLPDIEKNDPTKVYYVYNAPGGSGEDYEGLSNKPKVNNVTLIGNKTSSDLGMVIPLTQKQYDALPYEDQMDPNKVYYITDEGGFDPKGQVGYLPAVYSEQEKMVGVWTDGKPLYQKTFKNVATETQLVSNVDELVDYKIKRHGYNDINYFDIGDGFAVNDSAVCVLSNNIVTYTCWASSQGYINKTADVITIQYTKTTDDPIDTFDYASYGIFAPVIYSEEERVVGVWTNGKPLYQKTIESVIPSSQTYSISLGIANVDNIMLCPEGSFSKGGEYPMPYVHYDVNNVVGGFFTIGESDTTFNLRVGSNSKSYVGTLHLTVRYTKTTDVAGSGDWTGSGVPTVHLNNQEKIVGTFFGETLYEKSYRLTTIESTSITLDTIQDIDEMVSFDGAFKRYVTNQNIWHNIASRSEGSNYNSYGMYMNWNDSTGVLGISFSGYTVSEIKEIIVTIQYTKTQS